MGPDVLYAMVCVPFAINFFLVIWLENSWIAKYTGARQVKSTESSQFISFFVSLLSWVDELNKLACSSCMGRHSSAGRALQYECRGHGFQSR